MTKNDYYQILTLTGRNTWNGFLNRAMKSKHAGDIGSLEAAEELFPAVTVITKCDGQNRKLFPAGEPFTRWTVRRSTHKHPSGYPEGRSSIVGNLMTQPPETLYLANSYIKVKYDKRWMYSINPGDGNVRISQSTYIGAVVC